MTLNLATFNIRVLRDPSKCSRLLGELSNLGVNVAAVQETHFTCAADCHTQEDAFTFLSAYSSSSSVGISLLIGRILTVDVNLVLANDGGRQVLANIAVKSFEFRVVTVYVTNIASKENVLLFLDDLKLIVVVGDCNAIFDPEVGRGASGSGRCESSLIDLMARHYLVDRFRMDHPGRVIDVVR